MGNLYDKVKKCNTDADPFILDRMKEDWDGPSRDFYYTDRPDPDKMLSRINRTIVHGRREGRVRLYRSLGIAASFIALVVSGVALYGLKNVVNERVILHTLKTGPRQTEQLTLPDGTAVMLGPGSRLLYPEDFGTAAREVTLEGQAFFDVARDEEKRFIVHTIRSNVEVLGTAFEIFSFDRQPEEIVTLEGVVRVNINGMPDIPERSHILTADRKLVISPDGKAFGLEDVDADKYLAWRNTGGLSFDNEPLSTIIPRLEKWFAIEIHYEPVMATNHLFTFKVRNESPEEIFDLMERSSRLSIGREGEGYIIRYRKN